MYNLYYLMPWPDYQEYMESEGCYPGPDNSLFVPREYVDTLDINGDRLEVGNKVYWYDPETGLDPSRVFEIFEINGDIVTITDEYGEAEVLPGELELIKY